MQIFYPLSAQFKQGVSNNQNMHLTQWNSEEKNILFDSKTGE